jgi:hypothetical protein
MCGVHGHELIKTPIISTRYINQHEGILAVVYQARQEMPIWSKKNRNLYGVINEKVLANFNFIISKNSQKVVYFLRHFLNLIILNFYVKAKYF